MARVISHELAHQYYFTLSEKQRQDYSLGNGWSVRVDQDRNFYWISRKNGYVAEDGRTSVEEDCANNIEYFLYDPDKLKRVTPSAYSWVEKMFGKTFRLKKGQ